MLFDNLSGPQTLLLTLFDKICCHESVKYFDKNLIKRTVGRSEN